MFRAVFVLFVMNSVILGLGANAQEATETLFVKVRDQGSECGRGINRSPEAIACQKACDGPTVDLRVLLGSVPQPIPEKILSDIEACDAAYETFKSTKGQSEVPAETTEAEETADQLVGQSVSPKLVSEISEKLTACNESSVGGRHLASCLKFCELALGDFEKLADGDADLARQLAARQGNLERLPNIRECRRRHGFVFR
jgi:hypothetical protein